MAHHQHLSPDQIQALGHALGQAFVITGPTCLFLAGIACLVGLKTVAKDMEKMQAHLHQKDVIAVKSEQPSTHDKPTPPTPPMNH